MKKSLKIFCLLILTSCNKYEQSDIEIIKLNASKIAKIIQNSDTSFTHSNPNLTLYINREFGDTCEIIRDSLGFIIFFAERRNGKCISSGEYYPNGQLIGKIDCYNPLHPERAAVYFYPDGRISATGKWSGLKKIGVWKIYDKNGYLKFRQHFNSSGKLLNIEIVKI